ncbi:hypothetical protein [Dactylosporangium sp. CS-033363]|uniref:hypothetical protein n=1 Tax=Dactylosporangium sp. CS-033363 TaxID=3239935 RepID=UPI003D8D5780
MPRRVVVNRSTRQLIVMHAARHTGACIRGLRGGPVTEAKIAAGQLRDLFHRLHDELPAVLPLEHFRTLPENHVRYMPPGADPQDYPLVPNHDLTPAMEQYRHHRPTALQGLNSCSDG